MEKDVQRKAIKYLESKGFYVIKIISANFSGKPDLICCYSGRFIAIEIKDGNKDLTALQEYNLREILAVGGIAISVHSFDDLKNKISLIIGKLEREV